MSDLEEKSSTLDHEAAFLMDEFKKRRETLWSIAKKPGNHSEDKAETLQNIIISDGNS